jgi:hypothetical protein
MVDVLLGIRGCCVPVDGACPHGGNEGATIVTFLVDVGFVGANVIKEVGGELRSFTEIQAAKDFHVIFVTPEAPHRSLEGL